MLPAHPLNALTLFSLRKLVHINALQGSLGQSRSNHPSPHATPVDFEASLNLPSDPRISEDEVVEATGLAIRRCHGSSAAMDARLAAAGRRC